MTGTIMRKKEGKRERERKERDRGLKGREGEGGKMTRSNLRKRCEKEKEG